MTYSQLDKALLDDPRWTQRDACGVGFIAHIRGEATHRVVRDGLEILRRLDHRGGRTADQQTSDGAGLLTQIPHLLLSHEAELASMTLPMPGDYALGMFFLPAAASEQEHWLAAINSRALAQGCSHLFTRRVPIDRSVLGPVARAGEPAIFQVVLGKRDEAESGASFSWRLLILRKELEEMARQRYGVKQQDFYVVSLSSESVCYKGLVLSKDLPRYYLDLQNPLFTSAFAMVHQRFSTNTLPAWPLAQPFRSICHNGEINTLRGNINAMHARSRLFVSPDPEKFQGLDRLGPVCAPGGSDSAMLDNAIEFLLQTGRPLTQVLAMLIPEPWEQHQRMEPCLRAFYEYHSYRMEPWDGPAFIGFYHQKQVGAILDRNGLRPGRYWITDDGYVIMASEAGVLDRRPEEILQKGRLSPGRIFLVDMEKAQVIPDAQIKKELAEAHPYGEWLAQHRHFLQELPEVPRASEGAESLAEGEAGLSEQLLAFAYSKEDLRLILAPMANDGKEPLGSMGNDTPIAILSGERPTLYNYFKQLFAQVTNPPIDAIREELVTSLELHLGAETNLLDTRFSGEHVLRLKQPILTEADLRRIELYRAPGLASQRIASLYAPQEETLEAAVQRIEDAAAQAVAQGATILILSDRGVNRQLAPIPSLLITAAVHHRLIREGSRMRCSLLVESGEPREVHHFALLIAYGASAICPYLAMAVIAQRQESFGFKQDKPVQAMILSYMKAIGEGLLKVMSKMGISTVQSYRGSQIFEALGLSQAFVDRYFTWTPTRIEGLGISDFDEDVRTRHQQAFTPRQGYKVLPLPQGGFYHWRREGERHLHSPQMIASLQKATRINSREEFKQFCATLDREAREALNIRGLLRFKKVDQAIPLEKVEAASSIVKRFATGAMSFGSISKEAHETLAVAMNRIGARSNSGEGGEDEERYRPLPNGDLKRSAIKQVASARFGVTSHYLINADELQIKMAQGAKPGEGGQLPGHKVDHAIARVRHSTPGITLISPPPHHDIYSIEDLAQLIFDLKNANPSARVSVKLVAEMGVGTVASGVAKAKADVILISGYEGGTGASPLSSIKHAGLPWELGLVEAHRALSANDLRSRTVLQVDGQLRTPRDIAIATLLGAEEWGIGTGALIALGCIMMRKCHLNTCPVGVATQDPELRRKFQGQPEHVINYFFLLAEGLREIMASLGLRSIEEMVGRADLLEKDPSLSSPRVEKVDLSQILSPAQRTAWTPGKVLKQDHELEKTLDLQRLLPAAETALQRRGPVRIELPICNTDRAVGTMLSSEISRRWGAQGLRKGDIHLHFRGAAGQSFMAFGAKGIVAYLEGEVNDYCGKGLSGAQVIVVPPEESLFLPENNVICGNVSLYGATSGSLYVRGLAGERFAVRNSGAHAVVEGVGDHGCEYMTGGTVIVLGQVGRNFAAGMSGGYAYIYDADGSALLHINTELVSIEALVDEEDLALVQDQLHEHQQLTHSRVAAYILDHWAREKNRFLCVIPRAYRELMRQQKQQWLEHSVRAVSLEEQQIVLQQGGYHG